MTQVTAEFAGVPLESYSFTLNRGITPSVAVVSTIPVPGPLNIPAGRLRLQFGATTIDFEGMAAEVAYFRSVKNDNGWRWSLHLTDRRWKWQFGRVSGEYNIRLADGSTDPAQRKTPGELATLLLTRLGEIEPDVSRMPAGVFPYVKWDGVNPARALASLCESVGCEVVLGLDNRVTIWPIGQGPELPTNDSLRYPIFALNATSKPVKLVVLGSPTRFQSKLKLEPIGKEPSSGHHKLIDELSYVPSTGWLSESPWSFAGVTDDTNRMAALDAIWRWYQVTAQSDDSLPVPGTSTSIESAEQYFPLLDELVEASQSIEGIYRTQKPYVVGDFWPYSDAPGNASDLQYSDRFQLLQDRGIVQFPYPVLGLDTSGAMEKPILNIVVAHGVKDTAGEPVRLERVRILSGGSGAFTIRRPELFESFVSSAGSLIDNSAAVREEADRYLDIFAARFTGAPQRHAEYAGFAAIAPNGRIAQVRWEGGTRQIATTKASEMFEFDLSEPSAVQRRRSEFTDQLKESI